ncbi:MAG: hypothetical protein ACM3ON_05255 [Chloroflexota bacterium]
MYDEGGMSEDRLLNHDEIVGEISKAKTIMALWCEHAERHYGDILDILVVIVEALERANSLIANMDKNIHGKDKKILVPGKC